MHELIIWSLTIPPAITCAMTLGLLAIFLFGGRNVAQCDELPSVSVLLPFYNEDAAILVKVLEHIENQCYPQPLQVVVIDDGSTNDTPRFLKSWLLKPRLQHYQVLTRKHNGGRKGPALDYALAAGVLKGDIYVVVDSDTFIEPEGISHLATKLWQNPRCAAVCGSLSPENPRGSLLGDVQFYELIGFHGAIRSAQDRLGRVPILSGAFVAHRASAVKIVGGWGHWLVEDISWCWKALAMNFHTGYAANALATTQCPQSLLGFSRQRRRWARGRVEAFVTAWRVSAWKGMLFAPWFIITSMQLLFPPGLIMLPMLIYFQLWLPLILSMITLGLYLIITCIYISCYRNSQNVTLKDVLRVPIFMLILEMLIWLPNILGYIDEITRKNKSWLTR
ncbi:Poly-beta-1,6-N-acetyl-D-glucosamine synthase [Serratia fonticola]|uniref:glycosyltransferase family 2 protein n=1 Tax=Serratia fonticola TaxID=47917 RepID=UPI0021833FEB|nr:glycosyltransferase family 2 protein [Serratia fonticola]CAI2161187.1 Poly-beta-1,6-N-acetyl-D-glucosamine synthase [Serratia fonticola]